MSFQTFEYGDDGSMMNYVQIILNYDGFKNFIPVCNCFWSPIRDKRHNGVLADSIQLLRTIQDTIQRKKGIL